MSNGASSRRFTPSRPVAVHKMLSPLRRGASDPAYRAVGTGVTAIVWRATTTPEGPGLLALRPRPSEGVIEASAWGPGGDWLLDGVPELLGERDDDEGFTVDPAHRLLVTARRRHVDWRVPRTRAVVEAAVAAAIEQVVTGVEAHRAWRVLVTRFGEPAPGAVADVGGPAAGMRVPPTAKQWTTIPSWEWLAAGVELRRRRVALTAARVAGRLEQTLDLPPAEVSPVLRSLPGVGIWTSAEIRQRAHGDPDAFSFADYHVARNVSWALTGEVMDDAGCADVIAQYRGHRYRVQRLLELEGLRRPRRGPRMTLPSHTPSATRGHS